MTIVVPFYNKLSKLDSQRKFLKRKIKQHQKKLTKIESQINKIQKEVYR